MGFGCSTFLLYPEPHSSLHGEQLFTSTGGHLLGHARITNKGKLDCHDIYGLSRRGTKNCIGK